MIIIVSAILLVICLLCYVFIGFVSIRDTYDYKRHTYDRELMQEMLQHALENNKKIIIKK